MDAANVDLKGFTDEFYVKLRCSCNPCWIRSSIQARDDVWFEIAAPDQARMIHRRRSRR
jgi:hypothetical protein